VSQVFLSYSPKDEREAAAIRGELCRRGLNVWWDADIPVGKTWAHEVGDALETSDSMIVLVSPHAMNSDLVERELGYAITHANYRHRLFPVIITATRSVPAYFSQLQVFDITKHRTRGLSQLAQAIKATG
jgi:hypothetical protein